MTTQDYVSLSLALKLNAHGYNKYSPKQYVKNNIGEYEERHISFEECAYIEITSNINIIYVPTLEETYDFMFMKDSNWNVAVLWDNKLKGFHFIVQNIKTGYEYSQPTAPGEMNVFRMYEWGMEHALNRFDQKDKE